MKQPHSVEAEKIILGSLMIKSDYVPVISQRISEDDFYLSFHKQVYNAILDSAEKGGTDIFIITEKIGNHDKLQQMIDMVTTASNAPYYANIVKQHSNKRQLITACTKAVNAPLKDAVGILEKALEIGEDTATYDTPETLLPEVIDMAEGISKGDERILGIKTGWSDLDRIIDGIKKSEVTFISGGTKVGKTIFALNLIANWSFKRNLKGVVFSYEMANEYLLYRMLLNHAGVESNKIKNNTAKEEDWKKITDSSKMLGDKPLFLFDIMKTGVKDIYQKARMIERIHGKIDYIVIDHIHLISENTSQKRTQEIGYIGKKIKDYAKIFNVPVVCLAQLNRSFERRSDKRPTHYDLRDSGELEQIAAAIILLHRPGVYDENIDSDKAEVIVALNRFGMTGNIEMIFDRELMRYKEVYMGGVSHG